MITSTSKWLVAGAAMATIGGIATLSVIRPPWAPPTKEQPAEPPAPKTVSYYVDHPAELNAMLAICQEDPGRARFTPECDNARMATWELESQAAKAFLRSRGVGG